MGLPSVTNSVRPKGIQLNGLHMVINYRPKQATLIVEHLFDPFYEHKRQY